MHDVMQLPQWLLSLVTSVQTLLQIWLGAMHVGPVSTAASGIGAASPESSPPSPLRVSAGASPGESPVIGESPVTGESVEGMASDVASIARASCCVTSEDDASLALAPSTTAPPSLT
jgi:hypothetical protein